MQCRDDHERDLCAKEDADDNDQHQSCALSVTLTHLVSNMMMMMMMLIMMKMMKMMVMPITTTNIKVVL